VELLDNISKIVCAEFEGHLLLGNLGIFAMIISSLEVVWCGVCSFKRKTNVPGFCTLKSSPLWVFV
jgi:hypothetical protein